MVYAEAEPAGLSSLTLPNTHLTTKFASLSPFASEADASQRPKEYNGPLPRSLGWHKRPKPNKLASTAISI